MREARQFVNHLDAYLRSKQRDSRTPFKAHPGIRSVVITHHEGVRHVFAQPPPFWSATQRSHTGAFAFGSRPTASAILRS